MAKKLEKTKIIIPVKLGKNGNIFGSITPRMIAKKLSLLGYLIAHKRINMKEAFQKLGKYKVDICLSNDVNVTIQIILAKD